MHGKVSAAAVSPTGHHILFQDECCKPQVSRFHTYQTLSTVDKAMQTDPMLMQNPHHSAKCMKMQLMQSPQDILWSSRYGGKNKQVLRQQCWSIGGHHHANNCSCIL
jgi:hypothetical protein